MVISPGWWLKKHLEKYEFNGKDDIPYMKWKTIHSCLKPPTRYLLVLNPDTQNIPKNISWMTAYGPTHHVNCGVRRSAVV